MSEASLEQKLSEQAAEQWLRKIPDDPGGLLRRKFLYQYKNRGEPQSELNPW
jgi:Ca-activated chloride channel family protein